MDKRNPKVSKKFDEEITIDARYPTTYFSSVIEKDGEKYVRIGVTDEGKEIYRKIEYISDGTGKILKETLLIETLDNED